MDSIASVSGVGVPPEALVESAYRGPAESFGGHITRLTREGSEVVTRKEYCDGICRMRQAGFDVTPI